MAESDLREDAHVCCLETKVKLVSAWRPDVRGSGGCVRCIVNRGEMRLWLPIGKQMLRSSGARLKRFDAGHWAVKVDPSASLLPFSLDSTGSS